MALIRRTGFFWVLVLLLGQWASVSLAQTASEQAPGFSPAQASAGKEDYATYCASCHGAGLEGMQLSPSLVGARFDRTWRGKSADKLSFHLRRMPPKPGAPPGSLSNEIYTNILAYILQSNGLASSDDVLPSDMAALGDLIIPQVEGMQSDPDAPIKRTAAQSKLLANLPALTDDMLHNPSPNDWLHWGRTYDGQNFSPLTQINRETVGNLKVAWRAPLRDGESMPMPLVHQGVMFFQTYPDTVLAMDASNGMVLWRHQYKPQFRSSKKMGLALYGHTVFVPTSDLHVIALNAKTGDLIWDHAITIENPARMRRGYQLRSAPLVVGDKVIQAITASGAPKGAFVVALDIASGREVWRFNTIARPGEPGGNSWNGLPLEKRSGGSIWQQGTYDAELNLVYFGPSPTYDTGPLLHPVDEEGITNDALYTNCTVALNPDTGKLVWHYQHVANDQWDMDWAFERQIVTLPVNGVMRKMVVNVGKSALLDALDAATGEYLFSVDTGVQNIITAIDPKTGAKTISPDAVPSLERTSLICPSAFGARSWPPTSYSPQTKFVYVPLTEWCMAMGPKGFRLLSSGVGITSAPHPDTSDGMLGRVQAIDLENQELAWTYNQTTPPSTALLATGGGLVFSGDLDPSLKAFDDLSGELLWQAGLDDLPSSSLVSYSINDKQYIAVVVGLTNNHVRDISRAYYEFRWSADRTRIDSPKGGAAIWVFSL